MLISTNRNETKEKEKEQEKHDGDGVRTPNLHPQVARRPGPRNANEAKQLRGSSWARFPGAAGMFFDIRDSLIVNWPRVPAAIAPPTIVSSSSSNISTTTEQSSRDV